jgi:hypothetical protein
VITMLLPERGMTLLPPWPQAILRAGKRIENRSANVARRIGDWRGLIALTQSKTWDADDEDDAIQWMQDAGLIESNIRGLKNLLGDGPDMTLKWAGKLVGVAELLDVRSSETCAGQPWHAEGQWGLMLGRVWEVEPVPIMGGRGVWNMAFCMACRKLQAGHAHCRISNCKGALKTPEGIELHVVREQEAPR